MAESLEITGKRQKISKNACDPLQGIETEVLSNNAYKPGFCKNACDPLQGIETH